MDSCIKFGNILVVGIGLIGGSIIRALKDIRLFKKLNNIILLSPGAASFDQFKNFENRGNEFKKLSKIYAKKFI